MMRNELIMSKLHKMTNILYFVCKIKVILEVWIQNYGCVVMKRYRFTLIELLVVVAIIGILASLLLPSLAKARDKAMTTVCLSNQRQVGVALMTYSSTDDGLLPEPGPSWGDIMGGESFLNTPSGSIAEQASGNVLFCPTGLADQRSAHQNNGGWNYIDLAESRRPWESFTGKFSWYGIVGRTDANAQNNWRYNTWMPGVNDPWPRVSFILSADSGLAIHDGSNHVNTYSGNGGRVAARHNSFESTNSLFYDGHARTYSQTVLLSSRSNNGNSDSEIVWRGSRK